jgi:aspartyl aminopeptidase
MDTARFSETLGSTNQSTRRHNPKEHYQIRQKINVPAQVTMEDFIDADIDVAVIQKATDDTVKSIIGNMGRNSGNEVQKKNV